VKFIYPNQTHIKTITGNIQDPVFAKPETNRKLNINILTIKPLRIPFFILYSNWPIRYDKFKESIILFYVKFDLFF
jgi:hypothetical protein